MSYPITETVGLVPAIAVAASYTPDLSSLPTTTNDDYVILCVSCYAASGTLSISGTGWVEQIELDVAIGCRMAVYYCKVASGVVATPTISLSTGTGSWQCAAWVERDADGTSPFDNAVSVDSGANVLSLNSASYTPATNDCRILWFAAARNSGSTPYLRMLESDAVGEVIQAIYNGTDGMAMTVGSAVQDAAASTVKTVYRQGTGRMGIITIGIKNKTGGKRAISSNAGLSRVSWCGNFGDSHDGTLTPARSSRGAPTSRTINGIAVSTTAATFSADAGGLGTWGSFDAYATAVSGGWQGTMFTYSADIDMSGKFFSIEYYIPVLNQFDINGLIVVFEDNGGTNWKAYQLSQTFNMLASKNYTSVIDLTNSAAYDSGGTLDLTQVRKISILAHRLANTTSRSFYIRNLHLLSKTTLTGGNATMPVTPNEIRKALQGWGCQGLVGGESPAVTLKSDLQIGDGTIPTYFDATGTLTTFPSAYNPLSQREWNVGPNQIDVTIKAAAGDTINLVATSISAEQTQNLTFDAATSASATYSTSGASIIGVLPTWKTGIPCSLATFSSCYDIDGKGADFTNCTFTNPQSTACLQITESGATLDGCTLEVTGTSAAYHLSLGASVTAITLNGVTLSGTPATDKIYSALASGTLTITTDGTGTALAASDVTFVGGSTATAVIAAPQVYQKVTVSGFTAGSRIQIYDTTSSTELFNGTASSGNTVISGTTAVWTDPSAASADRAIRVRISYVSGATADLFQELSGLTCEQTGTTEEITYPVTPEDDTTYNDNAIDGPAIYATSGITFTDSATDLVNCDIASGSVSWPTIYACFVHWMNTASGIADDIAYINAVDTANYLLTSMKIKNTSSPTVPLVVSGGYGRDSTTGASIDLVDTTGGTLIFAPDHVVSYAVGSGVTSQDKTDIATAVLSAASTAPIASNIKQVNDYTVTGDGNTGTEWGPSP